MQFYFKNGRPPPNDMKEQFLFQIDHRFYGHLDGLQLHGESMIYGLISPILLFVANSSIVKRF